MSILLTDISPSTKPSFKLYSYIIIVCRDHNRIDLGFLHTSFNSSMSPLGSLSFWLGRAVHYASPSRIDYKINIRHQSAHN